jgi:hypothetical protein
MAHSHFDFCSEQEFSYSFAPMGSLYTIPSPFPQQSSTLQLPTQLHFQSNYPQQSNFFPPQYQLHYQPGWNMSPSNAANTISSDTMHTPTPSQSLPEEQPVARTAQQSHTLVPQQTAPHHQPLPAQQSPSTHAEAVSRAQQQWQNGRAAGTHHPRQSSRSIISKGSQKNMAEDGRHHKYQVRRQNETATKASVAQQQKDAEARAQEQKTMQALLAQQQKDAEARRIAQQQKDAEARRINQQQEIARVAAVKRLQEENTRLDNEQQEFWREQAEQQRVAQEQRLERERKLIRKEQLRKDPSALYRHYNEYLEFFPLGRGERRSPYLNNLLANRPMPTPPDSALGLAIQYAKDNWETYLEYPRDTSRATEWQKEKLGMFTADKQPAAVDGRATKR